MIIHGPLSRIMRIIFSTWFKTRLRAGRGDRTQELGKYLNEVLEEDHIDFCILKWWQINNPRYPILADVARNVLAVLISTVPFESVFSVGGCILDSFRSSLSPRSFICGEDWPRRRTVLLMIYLKKLGHLKILSKV